LLSNFLECIDGCFVIPTGLNWYVLAVTLSLWDERGITRKFYEVVLTNQGWRLAPCSSATQNCASSSNRGVSSPERNLTKSARACFGLPQVLSRNSYTSPRECVPHRNAINASASLSMLMAERRISCVCFHGCNLLKNILFRRPARGIELSRRCWCATAHKRLLFNLKAPIESFEKKSRPIRAAKFLACNVGGS
jgi:hypothetical protein